jgi:tetraacyldisaccharide 4'-kinase
MNSGLILPPLSALYSAAIRARLAAYSRGLLSASHLDAPVISVGNLTVGGTGKTPLVEKICRVLADQGRKVCILTRGYRRENPRERVLVSDGKAIKANEKESGDEAFLLAENLLGTAAVISDANRLAAGRWAKQELGVDTFVLDDGFQHLQIHRDLNVVVIDATDPWGGHELLPLGRLREPISGLKRADCAVITRAANGNLPALREELEQLMKGRPVLVTRMAPAALKTVSGSLTKLTDLPQPVAPFCGVGNPVSFFSLLQSAGVNLVAPRPFADHHRYTQKDINNIINEALQSGAKSVITTAKDAVKIRDLDFSLPCYVQEIEVVFEDENVLSTLLREAVTKTNSKDTNS